MPTSLRRLIFGLLVAVGLGGVLLGQSQTSPGGTFTPTQNYVINALWTFRGANPISFEGATNDGIKTTLAVADPTANRTLTLPDATDTLATLSSAQQFANKTFLADDGTALLPAYSFTSEPTLGFWRSSAANVTFQGSGLTTAGFMVAGSLYVGTSGNSVHFVRTTNGILNINNNGDTIGSQLKVDAVPTIASGFGTSPSVTAGSTPLAGSVNVGTGGVASTGTITFGGTAFPSAPFCVVTGQSGANANKIVASPSTTAMAINSTGGAFAASDVVQWICISPK